MLKIRQRKTFVVPPSSLDARSTCLISLMVNPLESWMLQMHFRTMALQACKNAWGASKDRMGSSLQKFVFHELGGVKNDSMGKQWGQCACPWHPTHDYISLKVAPEAGFILCGQKTLGSVLLPNSM